MHECIYACAVVVVCLCNNWWLCCHHESCCCLAYPAVVCAGGIRQIGAIGGMRDWWLATVVCLVLVVSVSLGPVVRERVSTQCTTDVPGVQSGSSDPRVQCDANSVISKSLPAWDRSARWRRWSGKCKCSMQLFNAGQWNHGGGNKRSVFLTLIGPSWSGI